MTEHYIAPEVWAQWAAQPSEGGTMAILTVNESADMLKRVATEVMNGEVVRVSPSYARAILDVLAAFEDAQKRLDAVPVAAIQEAHRFCATAFHPAANLDVMLGEWWQPFTSWLETQVQP